VTGASNSVSFSQPHDISKGPELRVLGMEAHGVYYRRLSLDAAHPSPTALKRYYKINGSNVELRWGPKALDERDIEETLIASCAACLQLVTLMAERVEHPEIAVRLSRCFEELKRQL